MTKVGVFKIETSSNIPNKGIVVSGQVIEGTPEIGRYISLNISGEVEIIKIVGIERNNPDEKDIIKYGLLLQIDNPNRVRYIATNKVAEQLSNIFESN